MSLNGSMPGRAVWEIEERAKVRGQKLAGAARHTDLRIARAIAKELAAGGRKISADHVRAALAERHPDIVGPFTFMGSVFKGDTWRFAGFVKSRTPGSHANRLCLWKLR